MRAPRATGARLQTYFFHVFLVEETVGGVELRAAHILHLGFPLGFLVDSQCLEAFTVDVPAAFWGGHRLVRGLESQRRVRGRDGRGDEANEEDELVHGCA